MNTSGKQAIGSTVIIAATLGLLGFLGFKVFTSSVFWFWLLAIIPLAPIYWGIISGAFEEIKEYKQSMRGIPIFTRQSRLYRKVNNLIVNSNKVIVEDNSIQVKGKNNQIVLTPDTLQLFVKTDVVLPEETTKTRGKKKTQVEYGWTLQEEKELNAAEKTAARRLIKKYKNEKPAATFESAIAAIREDDLQEMIGDLENPTGEIGENGMAKNDKLLAEMKKTLEGWNKNKEDDIRKTNSNMDGVFSKTS